MFIYMSIYFIQLPPILWLLWINFDIVVMLGWRRFATLSSERAEQTKKSPKPVQKEWVGAEILNQWHKQKKTKAKILYSVVEPVGPHFFLRLNLTLSFKPQFTEYRYRPVFAPASYVLFQFLYR
jgi:hypothetical protein